MNHPGKRVKKYTDEGKTPKGNTHNHSGVTNKNLSLTHNNIEEIAGYALGNIDTMIELKKKKQVELNKDMNTAHGQPHDQIEKEYLQLEKEIKDLEYKKKTLLSGIEVYGQTLRALKQVEKNETLGKEYNEKINFLQKNLNNTFNQLASILEEFGGFGEKLKDNIKGTTQKKVNNIITRADRQLPAHEYPKQLPAQEGGISLNTNVADMEAVMMREARKRAEERMTNEHAEDKARTGFGKIKGFFNRGKRFFTRKTTLDRYIQEELETLRAEMFSGKFAQASDRREKEFSGGFNTTTRRPEDFYNSVETGEINKLGQKYVNGEIDEAEFQRLFQEYIQNNPKLNNALQDIEYQGTNVLLKLNEERNYRNFIQDIKSEGEISNPDIEKYKTFLERDFAISLNENNKEQLIESLKDPKIIEKILSRELRLQIDVFVGGDAAFDTRNEIRESSQLNNGVITRVAKALDNHPIGTSVGTGAALITTAVLSGPLVTMLAGAGLVAGVTGVKRYLHYLNSHNQYEERVVRGEDEYARILRSIEEDEASLENANLSGFRRFFLQRSINKRRKKLELYQRRGVNGNPQLETRRGTTHRHFAPINVLNNKLEYYLAKNDISLHKYNDAKIVESDIDTSNSEGEDLWNEEIKKDDYAERHLTVKYKKSETLEVDYFIMWLGQGLARLDNWRATGYNFLKMNENKGETREQMDEKMEEEMNKLHKNILAGVDKLGLTLEDLRQESIAYQQTMERLNADLILAQDNFKSTRRNEALKKGATSGAIYLATSLAFQGIFHNGIFAKTEIIPGTETININDAKLKNLLPHDITTQTSYTDWIQRLENIEILKNNGYIVDGNNIFSVKDALDPNIADKLESILGQEKANKFITSLAQDTRPDTLWQTLKDTIFNNTQAGNDAKNQVMQFILEASAEGKNGLLSPELYNEAVSKGILGDIVNKTPRIDKIVSLMHNWGYTDVNHDFIANAIGELQKSGSDVISTWSTEKKVKVSEVLWCYVHRDGMAAGSPLYKVFMDKVTDQSLVDFTQVAEKINKAPEGLLSGLGIPTFRNTFLSPLETKNDSDEYGKPNNVEKEKKEGKKKVSFTERLKGYRDRFTSGFNKGFKKAEIKREKIKNGKEIGDQKNISNSIDNLYQQIIKYNEEFNFKTDLEEKEIIALKVNKLLKKEIIENQNLTYEDESKIDEINQIISDMTLSLNILKAKGEKTEQQRTANINQQQRQRV